MTSFFKKITQSSRNANTRAKRGFSLVEAGLVLGLAMFAFAIAYGFYVSGSRDIAMQSQTAGTVKLIDNIKRTFGSTGDYTGLDNESIIQSGMLPESFTAVGTTAIRHSWGSDLIIEALAGTPSEGFTLEFVRVPMSSCVEFASTLQSSARIVTVGTTNVKDLAADPVVDFTTASLMTACGGADQDITLTY